MKTKRSSVHNNHADFQGEISEKSAHLYTRVNRFVCNILNMIHSSNCWSFALERGGGGHHMQISFRISEYLLLY